jgi:hypothetical protein
VRRAAADDARAHAPTQADLPPGAGTARGCHLVAFIVLSRSWPDRNRHYVVGRWFGDLRYDRAERMECLHVEVEEPELSGEELAARPTRPVIVLSCHAGPVTLFLLIHQLLSAYASGRVGTWRRGLLGA